MFITITRISLVSMYDFMDLDEDLDTLECRGITTRQMIEISSFGWRGSRDEERVKRLSINKVFAYVNKLYARGWLSDDAYRLTYRRVGHLIRKIHVRCLAMNSEIPTDDLFI